MVKRDLIHTNIAISCIHIVIVVSTSSWTADKKDIGPYQCKHLYKGPHRTFCYHGYMRIQIEN